MRNPRHIEHATEGATLADLLERILDKGIVIAGDIKVKIVDIELLTIQIRLLICSVDKAKEIGMDWWVHNPAFHNGPQGLLGNPMPAPHVAPAQMKTPETAASQQSGVRGA